MSEEQVGSPKRIKLSVNLIKSQYEADITIGTTAAINVLINRLNIIFTSFLSKICYH